MCIIESNIKLIRTSSFKENRILCFFSKNDLCLFVVVYLMVSTDTRSEFIHKTICHYITVYIPYIWSKALQPTTNICPEVIVKTVYNANGNASGSYWLWTILIISDILHKQSAFNRLSSEFGYSQAAMLAAPSIYTVPFVFVQKGIFLCNTYMVSDNPANIVFYFSRRDFENSLKCQRRCQWQQLIPGAAYVAGWLFVTSYWGECVCVHRKNTHHSTKVIDCFNCILKW